MDYHSLLLELKCCHGLHSKINAIMAELIAWIKMIK